MLFSTFWLLFITTFIGKEVKDADDAKRIYAQTMIVAVIFGCAGVFCIGKLIDTVSPTITIPFAFLLRASAFLLFAFVTDPSAVYSYIVGCLMILGTSCEQICTDAMLMRNADREIRGTIYGTSTAFGFLGQFIFCLAGGFLFDDVSIYAPFLAVGVVDFLLAMAAIILGRAGVLKNDIQERRDREFEARSAMLLAKHKDSQAKEEVDKLLAPFEASGKDSRKATK